jgi:hypothetical protein
MAMHGRAALRGWVFGVLLIAGLAASAMAGERLKHSGTIVSIDEAAATFVLAEVGTWEQGGTLVSYRTISVTPATAFAIVARADAPPSGFAGDFVELAIDRGGLYPDDFVTVDCVHEGSRLVALKVTVTELPVPEIGIGSLR